MDSNNYQTPDLASVLRTLAAYVPPLQPTIYPSLDTSVSNHTLGDELEEGEYDPTNPLPLPTHLDPTPTQTAPQKPSAAPTSTPTPRISTPAVPEVDPTSIITWPAALRHVTRTVARNEAIMTRVRKLIEVQHQHEKQWWDGREALIKKQKDRIEGRKMVDDVLKAVGGKVDGTITGQTPEQDAAELHRYDRKVHRACTDMVTATTKELKTLGIPFFGIPQSSIIQSENESQTEDTTRERGISGANNVKVKDKYRLRQTEVVELQKRMIQLLEDLCND